MGLSVCVCVSGGALLVNQRLLVPLMLELVGGCELPDVGTGGTDLW